MQVYDCDSSQYKHEASHFELRYRCDFCIKRFQFPQLREKTWMAAYWKEFVALHMARIVKLYCHARTHLTNI